MDFNQYKKRLEELETKFKIDKKNLLMEFVNHNNPHKIGDIVTDHIGSVQIKKIKYSYGSFGQSPCAVYEGLELKKDLTPAKKLTTRYVFQSNLK